MDSISVSIPTDSDGFVSQECPACLRRFKVVFTEDGGSKLGYCPYCGHSGEDNWLTPEQAAYLVSQLEQRLVRPMLDEFAEEVNSIGSSGGFIRVSATVDNVAPVIEPLELDVEWPVMEFPCCGERMKYDGPLTELYCIVCGTAQPTA